jgi:hypothetical protein
MQSENPGPPPAATASAGHEGATTPSVVRFRRRREKADWPVREKPSLAQPAFALVAGRHAPRKMALFRHGMAVGTATLQIAGICQGPLVPPHSMSHKPLFYLDFYPVLDACKNCNSRRPQKQWSLRGCEIIYLLDAAAWQWLLMPDHPSPGAGILVRWFAPHSPDRLHDRLT